MAVSCVIVEDQTMFRQMLHNLLQGLPDLTVAASAKNVAEGLAACETHRPDILLLDLALPDGDGRDVALHLCTLNPAARVVILSGEASTFVCPAELREKVCAVLDKTQAFDELAAELKALVPRARGGSTSTPRSSIRKLLSRREYEIFLLIGRGLMSKEIAEKLGISPQTIAVHRRKIADKLDTIGPELVQLALKHYHSTLGSES